jgi:hypothetical protein
MSTGVFIAFEMMCLLLFLNSLDNLRRIRHRRADRKASQERLSAALTKEAEVRAELDRLNQEAETLLAEQAELKARLIRISIKPVYASQSELDAIDRTKGNQ